MLVQARLSLFGKFTIALVHRPGPNWIYSLEFTRELCVRAGLVHTVTLRFTSVTRKARVPRLSDVPRLIVCMVYRLLDELDSGSPQYCGLPPVDRRSCASLRCLCQQVGLSLLGDPHWRVHPAVALRLVTASLVQFSGYCELMIKQEKAGL